MRVGIHPSTAFRWRHAFLFGCRQCDGNQVLGWTEVISDWFAYSQKGQRNLDRPARDRPLRQHWPDARLGVNVLFACDRRGNAVAEFVGPANSRVLRVNELERGLRDRLTGPRTLLTHERPHGPVGRFVAKSGGERLNVRPMGDGRKLEHLRTVWDYRRRFRAWLRPFRGVATKYLANYLAWHRIVDNEIRNRPAAVLMRWPIELEFP